MGDAWDWTTSSACGNPDPINQVCEATYERACHCCGEWFVAQGYVGWCSDDCREFGKAQVQRRSKKKQTAKKQARRRAEGHVPHHQALLPDLDLNAPWRADAACRGMDPNIFFPEHTGGQGMVNATRTAKRICSACPVREPCQDTIMSLPKDEPGVWGGTGPSDRREIRRARRQIAA